MSDLETCWEQIVRTLAHVEADRAFQKPLIILAHEKGLSSPPGQKTKDRQDQVAKAMIGQASIGTKQYRSGHHLPLVWAVRVDNGRVLGLVFLQLELTIETNEGLRQARIRLVASKRHAHEGWALETEGHIDAWQGAQRILKLFLPTASTVRDRTFNLVRADHVPEVINELVREADRLHRVVRQALEG